MKETNKTRDLRSCFSFSNSSRLDSWLKCEVSEQHKSQQTDSTQLMRHAVQRELLSSSQTTVNPLQLGKQNSDSWVWIKNNKMTRSGHFFKDRQWQLNPRRKVSQGKGQGVLSCLTKTLLFYAPAIVCLTWVTMMQPAAQTLFFQCIHLVSTLSTIWASPGFAEINYWFN